jgi:hypothetical protein
MNTLTHWNRLKQLEALQHGLGSLFNRSPAQWSEGPEERMAVAKWAPEGDKEDTIKAELPAVKRGDVKVRAEELLLITRTSWVRGNQNSTPERI